MQPSKMNTMWHYRQKSIDTKQADRRLQMLPRPWCKPNKPYIKNEGRSAIWHDSSQKPMPIIDSILEWSGNKHSPIAGLSLSIVVLFNNCSNDTIQSDSTQLAAFGARDTITIWSSVPPSANACCAMHRDIPSMCAMHPMPSVAQDRSAASLVTTSYLGPSVMRTSCNRLLGRG
jgi:hypothetical protein